MLPKQYAWLADEPGPRMLLESVKLYGTLETPGSADNPRILAWADEVAKAFPSPYTNWAADFYNDDSIPWCGLGMAIVAVRAGRQPPDKYLSAAAWASWGVTVPKGEAMLGDVLVFLRKGGAHVAEYVGEDATHYHILGANQSDAFNIVRKPKLPIYAIRRAPYKQQPPNVRKVMLAPKGQLAGKEA
jgi:uncharacterized protein (TIGR02594 family)